MNITKFVNYEVSKYISSSILKNALAVVKSEPVLARIMEQLGEDATFDQIKVTYNLQLESLPASKASKETLAKVEQAS